MKITSIRVSVKRLIAIKRWENVTYECEVTASVSDGDNPYAVYNNALEFCKESVLAEMDRLEGKPPTPRSPQKFAIPDMDDEIPF